MLDALAAHSGRASTLTHSDKSDAKVIDLRSKMEHFKWLEGDNVVWSNKEYKFICLVKAGKVVEGRMEDGSGHVVALQSKGTGSGKKRPCLKCVGCQTAQGYNLCCLVVEVPCDLRIRAV